VRVTWDKLPDTTFSHLTDIHEGLSSGMWQRVARETRTNVSQKPVASISWRRRPQVFSETSTCLPNYTASHSKKNWYSYSQTLNDVQFMGKIQFLLNVTADPHARTHSHWNCPLEVNRDADTVPLLTLMMCSDYTPSQHWPTMWRQKFQTQNCSLMVYDVL